MLYSEMGNQGREETLSLIKKLRLGGSSIRAISLLLHEDYDIQISKTTVGDIVSKMELEFVDQETEEKNVEYDDQNLYVYTSKINEYGEKEVSRHSIPFELLNLIQKSYVRKGKNWSQQQILDNNRGTDEQPIFIKEKVWNTIKGAMSLNKESGIINETFLKILYDKFGRASVEGYIEEAAHDTTRERFRDLERRSIDRATQKQYEDVIRRGAKLEEYLERISEIVPRIKLPSTRFESTVRSNEGILYILFGDMHIGRTTDELELNIDRMLTYILQSGYSRVEFINVGDNLESPMLQGMHVSQILEMDYRGFEQIIKATALLEKIMLVLYEQQIECNMFGIVGNHGRGTTNTNDDPQRLPELALYEIVRSRLGGFVSYTKEAITTQTIGEFNFIISHGDYGFANKSPDQIMGIKSINNGKYTIIVSGHLHNPRIEQGPRYTRIQTPSLNVPDRYATDIVLRECLPGFSVVESINGFPKVSFIPCV